MARTLNPPVILESGDRLTREEFHRRYCARPDIKKAELVEGVVYVATPTRFTVHGKQHNLIDMWLGVYAVGHPEMEVASNTTVYLDPDNEVQPDACMFRASTGGSGARLTEEGYEEGYIEGAPDMVVEIAASSASYDLHDNLEAYRRNGVREYVVWRVLDKQIGWFRLRQGAYVPLTPDAHGVIASEIFPGLRLAVDRMHAGDCAGVLAALRARRG